jgi:prepilin-type N-terminal cleavage/methylation domain-containing protein
MQIKTNRKSGFTLVEIMIVVAIIGLLAALAIPNLVRARQSSQKSVCIANLKQVEYAIITWALENKKKGTDAVDATELYGVGKYIQNVPTCPASGTYTLGTVADRPICSVADHTY